MRKWCLHASSFIFDQIIIKVAGNQDRHKSSDEFDFGPLVSTAHLFVFFEMRFDLSTLTQVSDRCPLGYLFIQKLSKSVRTILFYNEMILSQRCRLKLNNVDTDQQSDLSLHSLPEPLCLKTYGHYGTVKFLKIRTHEKFAVITLKFEQGGFTVEYCISIGCRRHCKQCRRFCKQCRRHCKQCKRHCKPCRP